MIAHLRSNLVAYLALGVALTGTSYAVTALPRDSVTAKQIKSGAVRSAEVRNNSLRAADFKQGQLPSGPAGPQGAVGPAGPTFGAQGSPNTGATPEDPELVARTLAFSLPSAGRVYAYGHLEGWSQCTAGTASFGYYLDGQPIPGTGRVRLSEGVVRPMDFAGLTPVVAAGPHTLTLGVGCPSGTRSSTTVTGDVMGVILVG